MFFDKQVPFSQWADAKNEFFLNSKFCSLFNFKYVFIEEQ